MKGRLYVYGVMLATMTIIIPAIWELFGGDWGDIMFNEP